MSFFQVTSSGCRGGEVFDPGQRVAEPLDALHELGDDPPLVATLVIVLAAVEVVGAEAEHLADEAGDLWAGTVMAFWGRRGGLSGGDGRRRGQSDCGRGSWRRGGGRRPRGWPRVWCGRSVACHRRGGGRGRARWPGVFSVGQRVMSRPISPTTVRAVGRRSRRCGEV